jgi:hypothetical protein
MPWYIIICIHCGILLWHVSSPVAAASFIIYIQAATGTYENEQLQAENLRNQYEVLKNQLNPHMLFKLAEYPAFAGTEKSR